MNWSLVELVSDSSIPQRLEKRKMLESIGIKKTFEKSNKPSSVFLFDSSEFKVSGLKLKVELEKLRINLLKPLIIGNKADKLDEIEIINLRNEIPKIILISAKTGVEDLKNQLLSFVNTGATQ
jgi:tRNA modification GTPase